MLLRQQSLVRAVLGLGVGAIGGFSMTTSVFPFVIAWFYADLAMVVMLNARQWVVSMMIMWAMAGGVVGWYGGVRIGLLAMLICGVISGGLLGGLALGLDFVMPGFGIGLAYSIPFGLIVGAAFANAPDETN